MALPKIELPLFELEVPSTGKKVKYRAFTVKEEKILLIAQESKDIDQVILSVKQILNNCLVGVDVDSLAIFDLEYIMMNIRAKSVTNTVKFSVTDPDTNESVPLEFDIDQLFVKRHDNHSNIIKVNDKTNLIMRYPTFDQLKDLRGFGESDSEKKSEILAKIMFDCVHSVESDGSMYKLDEFSDKEVEEFFNSLPAYAVKGIETFFETMPVLRYEIKYKNKTGTEKTFVIEGMDSFFL